MVYYGYCWDGGEVGNLVWVVCGDGVYVGGGDYFGGFGLVDLD